MSSLSNLPFDPEQPPAGGYPLSASAYRALERWHPGRINALAIYCSDGRWSVAFDEFCHHHLRIPRYDRWAIPGGPAWLAMPAEEPGLRHAILLQLEFLVQAHQLERIVLISHYGCAWYGQLLQQSPDECLASQADDMVVAAEALRGWYPGLRVEAYLAMRRQDWVSFHPVDMGEAPDPRRGRTPKRSSGEGLGGGASVV